MAKTTTTDPGTLWRAIVQAGGTQAYIDAQLAGRGFLVARKDAASLPDREREAYKKALKAEAEERRKLAREAWRAYKANHIVYLGDGIYWKDGAGPDKWDLPHAEERAAENELPPLDSPQQLAEALGVSVALLRRLAYHREVAERVQYHRFTIPKRDGSERAIWAPYPILKDAQRWILRNIVERLIVHGSAHGFLAGRSILSNASVHSNPEIVVKIDLKDFFPTVTLPRVKGIFRKAGYREPVALLLALLCTESPREIVTREGKTYYVALGPRCLPQGAPTSPGLTNTLCVALDRRLTGLAKRIGWRYSRYADDLTFSRPAGAKGDPKLGKLLGTVRAIVESEGFAIHPTKTVVARPGGRQKITGLVVNGAKPPRVSRTMKRNLRAAIHNLTRGLPSKTGDSPATLAGYAAFVAMSEPELGRAYLDALGQLAVRED